MPLEALEKDREVSKETGISPMLAGAAVMEGVPRLLKPVIKDVPRGLSNLLASGKRITAEGGTPLKEIAEFSRQEVEAIQDFARASGVKIPIVAGADPELRRAGIGYYLDPDLPSERIRATVQRLFGQKPVDPVTPHIGLARTSLPHAFHEIGHATPIAGSASKRKLLHDIGGLLSTRTPGHLARLGIGAQVLAPPDEDASALRQAGYKYAPALVGATMLPELAEEARATSKALKGAGQHGISRLKALKELAPAFGTYAAAAAAPMLATLIAKNLVKALHARGQEKTSAARPGAEVRAPGALRTPASSAWKIGGQTPPKPKSIKPNSKLDATARGRSTAKPPSNREYHKDLLKSLYNPQRGYRLSVVG